MSDFLSLPDLAVRTLGGSVLATSDESFEEKENLINAWAPKFHPETFGSKGQEYDGWETARRRNGGHDWAIVKLGLAGVIRGIVIDTAWFKGNYPPHASVEAVALPGNPSVEELLAAEWTEIVPRSSLQGDTTQEFDVTVAKRFTHVRLNMFPDGGIARIRVHGDIIPDPAFLKDVTVDLAALENGARVTGCSNMFYSSPDNILAPGLARHQAEGWETARRRDDGNDWVIVELAAPGKVKIAEIDTVNLKFNSPNAAALSGIDARRADPSDPDAWTPLLERTPVQPDQRHKFRLDSDLEVTHVRLDIYPDGGMGRLRLWGNLTADGEQYLTERWNALR